MIQFNHVSKTIEQQQILCDLNFSFSGWAALLGKSGVGKTTLLRLLAGLDQPDEGKIEGAEQFRISYQFQEDRLLPWLNCWENVALVSGEERAKFLLGEIGLAKDWDKKPSELSGGMQRRVALVRALAYGGDLLLLDEPCKGMDKELRNDVYALIQRECTGQDMLLVTHEEEEAYKLAKTVYRLENDRQGKSQAMLV